MPNAKAVYDPDEGWKHRQFDSAQWEALGARVREKLRPFYPDKAAVECQAFGHPADVWANYSLHTAWSSISIIYGVCLRLTNAQLVAEQQEIFAALQKAVRVLSNVSPDLDRLFGIDADVLGTRDQIRKLIPHVETSKTQINKLSRARQKKEVVHAAAVEVAIRVLRIFKDCGGRVSVTADTDLNYVSDAIRILKILGDELGLAQSVATWKKTVLAARLLAGDL